MGIFGKKVKFEDEGLQDQPMVEPWPAPAPQVAPIVAPAPAAPTVAYGIREAIGLMRTLPNDRAELVGRVVRQTLESMNIHVADIVADGERREASIRGEIAIYQSDIAELEKEIAIRRSEITRLEADLAETTAVKQRLRSTDGAQTFKVAASS